MLLALSTSTAPHVRGTVYVRRFVIYLLLYSFVEIIHKSSSHTTRGRGGPRSGLLTRNTGHCIYRTHDTFTQANYSAILFSVLGRLGSTSTQLVLTQASAVRTGASRVSAQQVHAGKAQALRAPRALPRDAACATRGQRSPGSARNLWRHGAAPSAGSVAPRRGQAGSGGGGAQKRVALLPPMSAPPTTSAGWWSLS